MERRAFVKLAGLGAVGAPWSSPLRASGPRRHPAAEVAQEDPRFAEIAELIVARMIEYAVPGVAFGLSKSGSVAMRGFGVTNLDNPQPVTPDTVFPVASISKTVTATVLMRLRERGLVDLEAPVIQYIPAFRVADERSTRDVRIWHLLTHTPGWEGQLGARDRGAETLSTFLGSMRAVPALAPPGEVWSYNNAGWGVAGGVIEVVTGSPINAAFDELVFRPLGLERAFSRTGEAMTYRFAVGHEVASGETVVQHAFALPTNVPAGGCAMSLESLIQYARFHLGDGTAPSGERLLTEGSLVAMRTARVSKTPSTDEMGLGWHLRALDGVLTAAHGGTLAGHSLHLQLVPERDLCFAILTNSGGIAPGRGGWRLNEEVAAAVLELYEGLALARSQPTGASRGDNERMIRHVEPLPVQPPPDEYVGRYDRTPFGEVHARINDGSLSIDSGGAPVGVAFYAPDLAYVTSRGPDRYEGMPVEFVRDSSNEVRWVRVDGRVARRV